MTADTDTTDVLFGSCYDTVRGWVRADAGAVTVAGIVGFTTKVMAMVQRQIRGDGERKKALVLAVLRKVIVCDAPLEEADRAALLPPRARRCRVRRHRRRRRGGAGAAGEGAIAAGAARSVRRD